MRFCLPWSLYSVTRDSYIEQASFPVICQLAHYCSRDTTRALIPQTYIHTTDTHVPYTCTYIIYIAHITYHTHKPPMYPPMPHTTQTRITIYIPTHTDTHHPHMLTIHTERHKYVTQTHKAQTHTVQNLVAENAGSAPGQALPGSSQHLFPEGSTDSHATLGDKCRGLLHWFVYLFM